MTFDSFQRATVTLAIGATFIAASACNGMDHSKNPHEGTPITDGGGDASSDAGKADAGQGDTDAGKGDTDAGKTDAGQGDTDVGGVLAITCDAETCTGPEEVCCITSSARSCATAGSCAGGAQEAFCDGAEDCDDGAFCCQSHNTAVPVACNAGGCPAAMIACQDMSDCPAGFTDCCPAGSMAYPFCCTP